VSDPRAIKDELVGRHVRWAHSVGVEPSISAVDAEVSRGLQRASLHNTEAKPAGKAARRSAHQRNRPGAAASAAEKIGGSLSVGRVKRPRSSPDLLSIAGLGRTLLGQIRRRVSLIMSRGRAAGPGTELWQLANELLAVWMFPNFHGGGFRDMSRRAMSTEQARKVIAICERSAAALGAWQ
jgi:hypothetical protein